MVLALLAFLLAPLSLPAQSAAEADALYEQASALYDAQRFTEASELYAKAADIDRRLGESRRLDLAQDCKLLGFCYVQMSRLEDAERSLQQALSIFRDLGEMAQTVPVLNALGLVLYYRGRYREAAQFYEQALELARETAVHEEAALILNNLGLVFYAWGRYQQALEAYQQAHAENLALGREYYAATNLGNLAAVYLAWGRYPEAAESYRKAFDFFERSGDVTYATNTAINLAMVYQGWGRYEQAGELYETALQQAQRHGLRAAEASALNGVGAVYYATGRYDRSLEAYEKALRIFEELGFTLNVVSLTDSIGMVYQSWGRLEQALDHYRRALQLAEAIGAQDQVGLNLRNMASAYQGLGRFEEAVEYYHKGLSLFRELGRQADVAACLDGLGSLYFERREFSQARSYFEQALAEVERLGKQDEAARLLIHMAGVHQVAQEADKARESYLRALELTQRLGAKADMAVVLNNLGTLYLNGGDYEKAADYFSKAIAVKEELRDTAQGEIRRDFLASWISSYRWLAVTHLKNGKPEAAFAAGELAKARYLSEQLRSRLEAPEKVPGGIQSFRKSLSDKQAIVSFANIDGEYPLVIYADRVNLEGYFLDCEGFVKRNAGRQRQTIQAAADGARGFKVTRVPGPEAGFADMLRAYRWLLAQPGVSRSQSEARRELARELYGLLLEPLAKHLRGKEELIIIPDGILAYLPFETLITPDGRFLVETLHVRYLPSLTVSTLIGGRRWPADRAPLLAFGGAVYDELSLPADPVVSERELSYVGAQALQALEQNRGIRQAYGSLGLASWNALPGTLAEVNGIGRVVPGCTVITGAEVTESKVKSMSERGELARYRVLHFATHGLAVTEVPELSALVLSQLRSEQNREDGYLTVGEIAQLRLAADFANLSACETGLGRIYGGEGVVGLTYSFLVAGANGLCVSLWQVADASTSEFMVGLYELAQKKNMSYQRAMTEMKRRFIRDGAYSEPFYWAPFVYYGQ